MKKQLSRTYWSPPGSRQARYGRQRRTRWRLVASCLLLGCNAGTPVSPPGTVPIAGAWRYVAQQAASPATIGGTLDVTSRSATTFAGTADLTETLGGVPQQRLAGPVTGRMPDLATVELDVVLPGASRRHVGRLSADTIAGAWFDVLSSGGIAASGTFRAVRQR